MAETLTGARIVATVADNNGGAVTDLTFDGIPVLNNLFKVRTCQAGLRVNGPEGNLFLLESGNGGGALGDSTNSVLLETESTDDSLRLKTQLGYLEGTVQLPSGTKSVSDSVVDKKLTVDYLNNQNVLRTEFTVDVEASSKLSQTAVTYSLSPIGSINQLFSYVPGSGRPTPIPVTSGVVLPVSQDQGVFFYDDTQDLAVGIYVTGKISTNSNRTVEVAPSLADSTDPSSPNSSALVVIETFNPSGGGASQGQYYFDRYVVVGSLLEVQTAFDQIQSQTFGVSTQNPPSPAVTVDVVSQPDEVIKDTIFQVSARAVDGNGQVDLNFTDTATVTKILGPGNLSGTTSKAFTNGTIVFDDLAFDQQGTYQLRVAAPGLTPDFITVDVKNPSPILNSVAPNTYTTLAVPGNFSFTGENFADGMQATFSTGDVNNCIVAGDGLSATTPVPINLASEGQYTVFLTNVNADFDSQPLSITVEDVVVPPAADTLLITQTLLEPQIAFGGDEAKFQFSVQAVDSTKGNQLDTTFTGPITVSATTSPASTAFTGLGSFSLVGGVGTIEITATEAGDYSFLVSTAGAPPNVVLPSSGVFSVTNDAPQIQTIIPTSIEAQSGDALVTVGTQLAYPPDDVTVVAAGIPLTTTQVNTTTLQAVIPGSLTNFPITESVFVDVTLLTDLPTQGTATLPVPLEVTPAPEVLVPSSLGFFFFSSFSGTTPAGLISPSVIILDQNGDPFSGFTGTAEFTILTGPSTVVTGSTTETFGDVDSSPNVVDFNVGLPNQGEYTFQVDIPADPSITPLVGTATILNPVPILNSSFTPGLPFDIVSLPGVVTFSGQNFFPGMSAEFLLDGSVISTQPLNVGGDFATTATLTTFPPEITTAGDFKVRVRNAIPDTASSNQVDFTVIDTTDTVVGDTLTITALTFEPTILSDISVTAKITDSSNGGIADDNFPGQLTAELQRESSGQFFTLSTEVISFDTNGDATANFQASIPDTYRIRLTTTVIDTGETLSDEFQIGTPVLIATSVTPSAAPEGEEVEIVVAFDDGGQPVSPADVNIVFNGSTSFPTVGQGADAVRAPIPASLMTPPGIVDVQLTSTLSAGLSNPLPFTIQDQPDNDPAVALEVLIGDTYNPNSGDTVPVRADNVLEIVAVALNGSGVTDLDFSGDVVFTLHNGTQQVIPANNGVARATFPALNEVSNKIYTVEAAGLEEVEVSYQVGPNMPSNAGSISSTGWPAGSKPATLTLTGSDIEELPTDGLFPSFVNESPTILFEAVTGETSTDFFASKQLGQNAVFTPTSITVDTPAELDNPTTIFGGFTTLDPSGTWNVYIVNSTPSSELGSDNDDSRSFLRTVRIGSDFSSVVANDLELEVRVLTEVIDGINSPEVRVSARAIDTARGNAIDGGFSANVDFDINVPSGSTALDTSLPSNQGVAEYAFTPTEAGTHEVTITSGAFSAGPVSVEIFNPTPVLTDIQPRSVVQDAGLTSFTLTGRSLDTVSDVEVNGSTVGVSITAQTATTIDFTFDPAVSPAEAITVQALGELTIKDSNLVPLSVLEPAPTPTATKLQITGVPTASPIVDSGQTFSVSVTALSATDEVVATYTDPINIAISGTDLILGGTLSATPSNGTVVFNDLTVSVGGTDLSGDITLTATSGVLTDASVVIDTDQPVPVLTGFTPSTWTSDDPGTFDANGANINSDVQAGVTLNPGQPDELFLGLFPATATTATTATFPRPVFEGVYAVALVHPDQPTISAIQQFTVTEPVVVIGADTLEISNAAVTQNSGNLPASFTVTVTAIDSANGSVIDTGFAEDITLEIVSQPGDSGLSNVVLTPADAEYLDGIAVFQVDLPTDGEYTFAASTTSIASTAVPGTFSVQNPPPQLGIPSPSSIEVTNVDTNVTVPIAGDAPIGDLTFFVSASGAAPVDISALGWVTAGVGSVDILFPAAVAGVANSYVITAVAANGFAPSNEVTFAVNPAGPAVSGELALEPTIRVTPAGVQRLLPVQENFINAGNPIQRAFSEVGQGTLGDAIFSTAAGDEANAMEVIEIEAGVYPRFTLNDGNANMQFGGLLGNDEAPVVVRAKEGEEVFVIPFTQNGVGPQGNAMFVDPDVNHHNIHFYNIGFIAGTNACIQTRPKVIDQTGTLTTGAFDARFESWLFQGCTFAGMWDSRIVPLTANAFIKGPVVDSSQDQFDSAGNLIPPAGKFLWLQEDVFQAVNDNTLLNPLPTGQPLSIPLFLEPDPNNSDLNWYPVFGGGAPGSPQPEASQNSQVKVSRNGTAVTGLNSDVLISGLDETLLVEVLAAPAGFQARTASGSTITASQGSTYQISATNGLGQIELPAGLLVAGIYQFRVSMQNKLGVTQFSEDVTIPVSTAATTGSAASLEIIGQPSDIWMLRDGTTYSDIAPGSPNQGIRMQDFGIAVVARTADGAIAFLDNEDLTVSWANLPSDGNSASSIWQIASSGGLSKTVPMVGGYAKIEDIALRQSTAMTGDTEVNYWPANAGNAGNPGYFEDVQIRIQHPNPAVQDVTTTVRVYTLGSPSIGISYTLNLDSEDFRDRLDQLVDNTAFPTFEERYTQVFQLRGRHGIGNFNTGLPVKPLKVNTGTPFRFLGFTSEASEVPSGLRGNAFFPGDPTLVTSANFDAEVADAYPATANFTDNDSVNNLSLLYGTGGWDSRFGLLMYNMWDCEIQACKFYNIPKEAALGLFNVGGSFTRVANCEFIKNGRNGIRVRAQVRNNPLSDPGAALDALPTESDTGGAPTGNLLIENNVFVNNGYQTPDTYTISSQAHPRGQTIIRGNVVTGNTDNEMSHLPNMMSGTLEVIPQAQFSNNILNHWYTNLTDNGSLLVDWNDYITNFFGATCSTALPNSITNLVCSYPYLPNGGTTPLTAAAVNATGGGYAQHDFVLIEDNDFIQTRQEGAGLTNPSTFFDYGPAVLGRLASINTLSIVNNRFQAGDDNNDGLVIDRVFDGDLIDSPVNNVSGDQNTFLTGTSLTYLDDSDASFTLQQQLVNGVTPSEEGFLFATFDVTYPEEDPAPDIILMRATMPVPDQFATLADLEAHGGPGTFQIQDEFGFVYPVQFAEGSYYPSGNLAMVEVISKLTNLGLEGVQVMKLVKLNS